MFELMLLELTHQKKVELLLESPEKTLHLLAPQNLKAFVRNRAKLITNIMDFATTIQF
jgi:hypothetical protein